MIERRVVLVTAALAALAACGEEPVETIVIPAGVFQGAADPLIQSAENAFHLLVARPHALLDQPANAAYALLMYEIATIEASSGRLADRWPGRLLREARPNLRAAAAIASEASAQMVVEALWAATRALRQGEEAQARAALGPPVSLDPTVTRDRLQRFEVPRQVVRPLRELRLALEREAGSPR